MTKAGILASALVALTAAPVLAGGLDAPATETIPSAAPVIATGGAGTGNWDGFYAGGQLGYADIESEINGDETDDDGVIGGVHLGWQGSVDKLVYGFEIATNAADIEIGDNELDSLSHLKARAGYDLGQSLIYVTAGAAQADFEDIGTDEGVVAGFGYDYLVTDRLSVGAEALYNWFDDFDDTGADISGPSVGLKASFHF